MAREQLDMTGTIKDLVFQMSEGNPGGLTVLLQFFRNKDQNEAFGAILDLDDMNIRGSQIWLGFKDHCGQDFDKFFQAVRDRDPAMVQTINQNGGGAERAVTSGASFNR